MKLCTSTGKMFLTLTKLLFAFSTCHVSRGYRIYEERAEFVTEGEVLNISENESIIGLESAWEAALMDRPGVVVIELRQPLVEKIKTALMKENESYPGSGEISLATFDSTEKGTGDVKFSLTGAPVQKFGNCKNNKANTLTKPWVVVITHPLIVTQLSDPCGEKRFAIPAIKQLNQRDFAKTKITIPEILDFKTNQFPGHILIQKETLLLLKTNIKSFQGVTAFDDYVKFREAVLGLRPTPNDKNSTPSIHAIVELLRRNVSSSLLLVTMTKPDQDFTDDLIRAMTDKSIQLSVLWVGDGNTNDYLPLKTIVEKTKGRLIKSEDNEENMSRSNFDNQKIRFPERSSENDQDYEMPLTSRAADQRVIQKAVVPLIVEVASGSSLEIRPGTASQIQFTVKNNINVALPAFFNAKFNGVVQNVQPPQAVLPPSGTVTVIVNLQPLGPTQNLNAVGTLTLFTHAANRVTARSALISMTPQATTDYTAPKMRHKYDGDCTNYKEPQNCEHGQWSLEVTLQDEDSGLLKILSEPYGLLFHSEFIAGSKTPVTAQYTATCCQPVVHIWGEDLRGNYVKKSFDVFNQNLLAGEIASIVLGVLLLLLIIVMIIVAVVLVRRRNRRNLIIPRPRSGSR